MTILSSRRLPGPVPLVAAGVALAVVVGLRLLPAQGAGAPAGLDDPLLAAPPPAEAARSAMPSGRPAPAFGAAASAELATVREDIDFWAARLAGDPRDIVAAVRLADMHTAEARLTGDVTAYLRAEAAADAALAAQPGYVPAQAARAAILVALHRFPDARDAALAILERDPVQPTALGVLGDARLELGDLDGAREAYTALATVADRSSARVRLGRLAFVSGDPAAALEATRAAVVAAGDEGLEGGALAFHHVTLGELLRATGDGAGARAAYAAALAARPGDPGALVGLARLHAFDGDLDAAIDALDAAVAAVPTPDWLALRADLLARRGDAGDADRAAADLATVDAIAALAGDAAGVYDRGRSLFLSDHGLEPELAVRLAADELAVRPDAYGADALAWALLNAGRAGEAREPMAAALAAGTRDARLWYHAGLVAAATGEPEAARAHLSAALALGPALDPAARDRATAALEALR